MIWSAALIVPSLWAMTRTVLSEPNLSRASCMEFSVTLSRALVASSRTTILGFFSRHRAMAARCFSPPDNFIPLSPTIVSNPSGRLSTKAFS
mmetsp:Transcript_15670/g.28423  ORF Transcript_15670/g.28423 Transcript_15670/m.28423 type:complete len:92 (+) Transcript_15670:259-534(+)